ncbi:MAG: hypothetical protein EPO02_02235 [Nitrospirae bacterium]|nr:MAG: hypothetical protein EPO02_02235 [Nitrospirota bacterium]
MNRGPRILQAIGAVGLLSVLACGGLSGIARADDMTGKQPAPVAQNTPPPATSPDLPDPAAKPAVEKSTAGEKDKHAEDKKKTKAKFLAIFLTLFDGHRGGTP